MFLKKLIRTVYPSVAVFIAAAALCACQKPSTDTAETSAAAVEESTVDESELSGASESSDASVSAENAAAAHDKVLITAEIHKDVKFDSADLSIDADDLTAAGFALGDSVDVAFSNGVTLTDIPYFNGYYVKTGNPVVVAYPGNAYVLIACSNGDFWTPYELEDGMTVDITLNTKAKYLVTQEAIGQSYSTERADFDSDIVFANFRALKGGNLKDDFLYRGASPVDNRRNRAAYANELLEQYNIACVIDLADSDEEMLGYFEKEDFSSDYAKKLYEEGKTVTLSMNASYSKDKYKQSVVKGLRKLLEVGGPAYIHCLEGKDRTGFVCMLIEALAGASYEEMCDDYMTTYANYYNITLDGTPDKYNAIVTVYFDAFMEYLSGETDAAKLHDLDYTDYAKQYLIDGGMTEAEIDELLSVIKK